MNNHINIRGVSDERKYKQYSNHLRFQRPFGNPNVSKAEAKQQKNPGPVIYEWQLVDDKPEKSWTDEVGNLYVTDWQMISF
jgi:hypothetical protein